MNLVLGLLVAAVGLGAALANKLFAEASVETMHSFCGRKPTGQLRKIMIVWARGMAVVIGLGMALAGAYFAFIA